MARTDEAEAFFDAVYSAIQEIPYGKVSTYAHIARLIGTRMSLCTRLSYSYHKYLTTLYGLSNLDYKNSVSHTA